MTRGHPVLCGALRRNDKTRVAAQEKRKKRRKETRKETTRKGEENDDDGDNDDQLVATVAGNAAFIPIRRYDTPKRSPRALIFACASVQQWYQPYTRELVLPRNASYGGSAACSATCREAQYPPRPLPNGLHFSSESLRERLENLSTSI